jgi:hypothetical protein
MPTAEELAKTVFEICANHFETKDKLKDFIRELDETLEESNASVDELLQELWHLVRNL